MLEELAIRASRYNINLDGFVLKDNISYLRAGYATVSSGILQPREEIFIGGAGLCENGKAIRVNLCPAMLSVLPLMGVNQGGYKDSS